MTRSTCVVAMILAAMSMTAAADGTLGGGDDNRQTKTFTEIDTNSDGVLEEDEVNQADVSGDFDDMDGDGDGEVNRNEYYQYHRQQTTE